MNRGKKGGRGHGNLVPRVSHFITPFPHPPTPLAPGGGKMRTLATRSGARR